MMRFFAVFCMFSMLIGIQAEVLWQDDFSSQIPGKPVRAPWGIYGKRSMAPTAILHKGKTAVRLRDTDKTAEVGLTRNFQSGKAKFVRFTVDMEDLSGKETSDALLQIRTLPSEKFKQWSLQSGQFTVELPAGDTHGRIYLYSHAAPTPDVVIKSVKLEGSVTAFPMPKVDPRKVPGALTDMKRDLCIQTALVKNGKPAAVIAVPACYRDLAQQVSKAVKAKTGVALPIVPDTDFARMRDLKQNLILFGNRDDNAAIARLYGFHYTLLDACYPGPAGNELRSAHNIFGDKHNVIFAGSSSEAGTRAAVKKLLDVIAGTPAGKDFQLGYLMDITLDPAKKVPAVSDNAKIWEGSRGYGERGTFAWNQLSKNLALFYTTGDVKFAREFLRLAFPTPEVSAEILRRDDEAFWDVKRPLESPYHYRALQMILYWDLVEEHPVFDGIREKVTAGLYQQNAAKARNRTGTFGLQRPAAQAGNRHAAWEALSTWGIARYFYKHYQTKDGEDGMRTAEFELGCARKYMALEAGSLFWFNTFMEPVINYMILSGAEEMQGAQSMKDYCHSLMALSTGVEDWDTNSTAFNMYSKLAWLTDDEAPMMLLRHSVPDHQEFRLGQSWYPRKAYKNNFFRDSQGKVFRPAFSGENMRCYQPRPADSKFEDLAQYLSYRNGTTSLLLDTKYEQGRNPFHNFAIIRLNLGGMPVLAGHYNTLQIFCNGISSGRPGFFTDFRKGYGKLDQIVTVDGTVPDTNDHDWNRVLVTRQDRWTLAVDTVTPRVDMAQSVVNAKFQFRTGNVSKILPNGDLAVSRGGSSARDEDGYFMVQDRDLLGMIHHSQRYYSAFLNCPGVNPLNTGESFTIDFNLKKAGPAEVILTLRGASGPLRGHVDLALDGKTVVKNFLHASVQDLQMQPVNLGTHNLAAGKHTITVTAASFPRGSGVITIQSLAVHRPGKPVPLQQDYAVISCGRPALPEEEAVTTSASGKGNAVTYDFIQPGKKGQDFKLISLIRRGQAAATASAAQVGAETALLLPEPALLIMRDEGFVLNSKELFFGYRVNMPEFSGVNGIATFEYDKVSGKRTVRLADGTVRTEKVKLTCPVVPEEKIRQMLAAKSLPAKGSVPAAEDLKKVWEVEGPGFPGAVCRFTRDGKNWLVASHGKVVRLYTVDGRMLWEKNAGAATGAICYWPAQDLIIAGSGNEKITAWDFAGNERWTATAQMSKELVDSVKFYWFKKALPGVTMLHVGKLGGKEWLFAGGTGTVEVYDAQGKLDSRHWGDWGYTSEAIDLPGEIRFVRHQGANPNIRAARYANGKIVVINRGMDSEKSGGSMGRFGFSMVGRWGIYAGKLAPGRDMQTVETLNGVHNRLIIRDLNGKIRYEADLGPGFVAAASIYGQDALTRRNVRGMILQGPDQDGNCRIVLAFNRKFVAAFDPELKVQWMTPLPDQPVRLLAVDKDRTAVSCANGWVFLLDNKGRIIARRQVDGLPAEMLSADGRLFVFSGKGVVTALDLK